MKQAEITLASGVVLQLELYDDVAPKTVENFLSLAAKGFYDGLKFHRVIEGFVAQGGCPQGTGTGGPGYTIPCETANNPRVHLPGSLSMAHAGKNTGGSQFFLCHVRLPHLDGVHTVFGQVTSSMEEVLAIRQGDAMTSIREISNQ
jgi:peptidyl-prolyl cis-trans isomerase B (cyclophilin B)